MIEITQAVVIISVVIAIKYLVPWIKSRIEVSQYEWILQVIEDAVLYAEQTITAVKSGQQKLEVVSHYVRECLTEKNVTISGAQLRTMIESAVYTMKEVQDGNQISD